MRTSSRRKLDIGLVAGSSLVVGVVALVGGVASDTERVERYWTSAEVRDDGSARVTEVIDYEFGALAQDRHGIFRWIPGLTPSTPVAVTSPGAPADTQITPRTEPGLDGSPVAGVRIQIGDAAVTVSGQQRYQLGYDLPEVRRGDTVDWEAVGTGWDVGIDDAVIHLVTPFELDDPRCFEGSVGSTASCRLDQVEPGHVTVTVEGLSAQEGVSIEGRVGATLSAPPTVPAPPAGAPDDPGTGLLPPAGTAAAATLVAAVPVTLFVRRAGRERVAPGGAADAAFGGGPPVGGSQPWPTAPPERSSVPPPPPVPGADLGSILLPPPAATAQATAPAGPAPGPAWTPPPDAAVSEIRVDAAELADMATTEFAPPSGVAPAQGGIVLREEVRPEHKVAWLIQAAIDGVIDIDDSGPTTIRRIAGATRSPEQQPILDRMFARSSTIELGSYDKHFAAGWSMVGSELDTWRRSSGMWDARADTRRILVRVLGIVAVVLGLVAVAAGGAMAARLGAPWLALAAVGGVVAGSGLAAAVSAWELHVRTPAGSALWLRVESFRRFLAGSEAYHAEEAAKRGVLREYTAWALALGEIDRWKGAVAASTIAPDVAGVHYAYMAPMLLASTTSSATAPSSSGGGFGGGGFGGGSVGGGAGGGGGGSW